MVGGLEMNDDLGNLRGHALGSPHVERHPGPTPVIYIKLQGRIGLSLRIRVHPGFFPVSHHGFTVTAAGQILPPYGILKKGLGVPHDAEGFKGLNFFIPDLLWFRTDWGFHHNEGDDLQQMVLKHVPEGTGPVVIAPALSNANTFGTGNFHMSDIVAVPKGFEDAVGKTGHQEVLYGLLAQVMVNPVYLGFPEVLLQAMI